MSNVVINQTRLHLGLTAGAKVDMVSSDSYSVERTRQSSPVPQRAATVQQLGRFRTVGYGLSCMADARHDAVLREFPKRLFHTSVRRAGGGVAVGESAVSALTLNLPLDEPMSWAVSLMADGDETAGAAPPEFAGTTDAYHESAVEYRFGGPDFLADLSAASQGGSLTGNYTTVATMRRTGPGVVGVSHDVSQFGFTASLTLLLDGEGEKLLDNESGILVLRHAAADWAYAIPMVLSGLSQAGPVADKSTFAAALAQTPGPVAMSAPSSSAAEFEVSSGGVTYRVGAGSITLA